MFFCVQHRAEIEVIETFLSSSNATDSFVFTLFDGGNYLKALLLKRKGKEIAEEAEKVLRIKNVFFSTFTFQSFLLGSSNFF